MRREIHDGPHPALAEALNNLGFVIDETGQTREAEQLFREALEMKRVLLGSSHPEIAIGLNNVAGALYEQRKYNQAQVYLRERAGNATQAPRRGSSRRRDDAQ
jgi:Tfp pilus assembly protein PilF